MEREKRVVLFPNLSDRLREKGFEALHNKQYIEALDCFDELREWELQDEQSEFAAVVCLVEMHALQDARQRCEMLLQKSKTLFLQAFETYITILVQLHDYKAVREHAAEALRRDHLTDEQKEQLRHILSFAEKMGHSEDGSFHDEQVVEALQDGEDAIQLQALYTLQQRGIRGMLPYLRMYLEDESKHPYIKSRALELMMEHGVSENVIVNKFGQTTTVIPCELEYVHEQQFIQDVLVALEQETGAKNPTLQQVMAEYWQNIAYVLFPLPLRPAHARLWAAVLEKIGCERLVFPFRDDRIARRYDISVEQLEQGYEFLSGIEREGVLPI